jgi:hypothetical protein
MSCLSAIPNNQNPNGLSIISDQEYSAMRETSRTERINESNIVVICSNSGAGSPREFTRGNYDKTLSKTTKEVNTKEDNIFSEIISNDNFLNYNSS